MQAGNAGVMPLSDVSNGPIGARGIWREATAWCWQGKSSYSAG